jgi:nucleotide-binding universal stress UspA family protein
VHAVPLDETFDRHGKERLALKADLRRLADAAQVPFAYRVQQGDPAEIVLLHALSIDPDVIVVGSHQRSGLARLRVGSVSERIVTRTRMPVLVVPAGARPNRPVRSGTWRSRSVTRPARRSSVGSRWRAKPPSG